MLREIEAGTQRWFQVLPKLGEPQQGTAISSVSRIKACIRCIQHLGCLEVAQDASISMVEPHRSVVEGHDTPSKLAIQQNSTLADVETDSEVSVPNAEEDVGSEDSALEGVPTPVNLCTPCHSYPLHQLGNTCFWQSYSR